jgi:hypothetical protein
VATKSGGGRCRTTKNRRGKLNHRGISRVDQGIRAQIEAGLRKIEIDAGITGEREMNWIWD